MIAISDSGAPVSAAQAAHLFDPWFVPGAGERPGFAFAWKLVVDELGGKLAIEPRADSGVTLLVRLPNATAVG